MIEFRNVTKSYLHHRAGRIYVFRDLSFKIPEGKNIALIGKNGAGKSTMMRLICGLDYPDHGKVLRSSSVSWPVGLSGGFQGSLTGRENAKFVCRTQGYFGASVKEKLKFIEGFAEIGEYFDMPVKTYSSGMRSRLAFGMSLAFDFDYYMIDEALSVGDAHFRKKAAEALMSRISRSHLILVTHGMGQVRQLCDLVLLLDKKGVHIYSDIEEGIAAYRSERTHNE